MNVCIRDSFVWSFSVNPAWKGLYQYRWARTGNQSYWSGRKGYGLHLKNEMHACGT